ncbi:hypothetical protein N665_0198s0078 [Sinapis alba]|nr:hypothetical protein N665_0198s0078 [Sinapis alba]
MSCACENAVGVRTPIPGEYGQNSGKARFPFKYCTTCSMDGLPSGARFAQSKPTFKTLSTSPDKNSVNLGSTASIKEDRLQHSPTHLTRKRFAAEKPGSTGLLPQVISSKKTPNAYTSVPVEGPIVVSSGAM